MTSTNVNLSQVAPDIFQGLGDCQISPEIAHKWVEAKKLWPVYEGGGMFILLPRILILLQEISRANFGEYIRQSTYGRECWPIW